MKLTSLNKALATTPSCFPISCHMKRGNKKKKKKLGREEKKKQQRVSFKAESRDHGPSNMGVGVTRGGKAPTAF